MEMVMSITGTTIAMPPTQGAAGHQKQQGQTMPFGPTLGLSALTSGSGNDAQMYECEVNPFEINGTTYQAPQYGINTTANDYMACTAMTKESLASAGFVPIDSYVKMMMLGPDAPNLSPTVAAEVGTLGNGLVNLASGANINSVTTAQQNFIGNLPWPVFAIMQKLNNLNDPAGVNGAAVNFVKPIEAEIDERYLLAIDNVVRNINNGNAKTPSPKMKTLLLNINRDIHDDDVEIDKGNGDTIYWEKVINAMEKQHPFNRK